MTETQTQPDCPQCGGTGFIPPFMDECDCASVLPTPIVGTIVEVDGGGFQVWTGSEWKPVETAEMSIVDGAHRIAATATPDWLPPLSSAPMFAAPPVDVTIRTTDTFAETIAAAAEADWKIDDDDDAEYAEALADITELDDDDLVDDAVESMPKTSADTFAALEAACDTPVVSHAGWTGGKGKPVTEAQRNLMEKLIAERDPANPVVAASAGALTTPLSARAASAWIDKLMAVPADEAKKPLRENSFDGACQICGGMVPAKAGHIKKVDGRWKTFHNTGQCLSAEARKAMEADRITEPGLYKFVHDGTVTIYRVRKSRSSTRLYGEKVVPVADGTVSFAYNSKAMSFLRASDKLTWAEARSFGAAYGACVACGRTLSDARSLVQGYGATCAKHYHWPTVTTKQAEAIIEGILTWDDVVSTFIP